MESIRVCQVKHTTQSWLVNTLDLKPWTLLMRFMTLSCSTYLTRVATHKGLDKCLSILACLLLLSFWPHILALLPTINQVTPSHGCTVVKIWLRPAGLSGTTCSQVVLRNLSLKSKGTTQPLSFQSICTKGKHSMVKIIILRAFYSQASKLTPTYFPLSHTFWWSRAYL